MERVIRDGERGEKERGWVKEGGGREKRRRGKK
jgi:hypothetical protein